MKRHFLALTSALCFAPALLAFGDGPQPTDAPIERTGHSVLSESPPMSDDGGLGGASCDPCRRCVWAYGEYLNWWSKADKTPPLLTTLPAVDGAPPAQDLRNEFNDDPRKGYRVGVGFFPNCPCSNLGLEANWFWFRQMDDRIAAEGTPTTFLARPFQNAVTGQPDLLILGGGQAGLGASAVVRETSRLEGGNAGVRWRIRGNEDQGCGTCCCNAFLLAGYQYYRLSEGLDIATRTAGGTFAPFSQVSSETFNASNQYHGGYLGLGGEVVCGKVFIDGNVRAGVGSIHETADVFGSTTTTQGGATVTIPSGQLLALQSNSGRHTDNDVTWSGEAGVRVGYQPTCWFRTYVGYDYLYIDRVLRPGGEVNTTVNRGQLFGVTGGPAQPNFSPSRDSFWAHGFNVGIEIKF
jgi:hypothetical protein